MSRGRLPPGNKNAHLLRDAGGAAHAGRKEDAFGEDIGTGQNILKDANDMGQKALWCLQKNKEESSSHATISPRKLCHVTPWFLKKALLLQLGHGHTGYHPREGDTVPPGTGTPKDPWGGEKPSAQQQKPVLQISAAGRNQMPGEMGWRPVWKDFTPSN